MRIKRIFGDKVLVDVDINQNESKIIAEPDDVHKGTLKAVVIMIGTECKEQTLKVGNLVLIKNFVGAPNIRVGERQFKLYDTANILAIL